MSFNNIAWVITGGGSHIRECVDAMFYLKKNYNAKITLFLTEWGYEVARLFGVLPRLKVISPGRYYEEFLVGNEGMYYIGRINLRRYKVLVIAPATSNTVAKVVNGIADTVATALFAQAQKSDVPVIVLPTDMPGEDGLMETEIPCSIERSICMEKNCEVCEPMRRCPVKAIERVEGYPRINYAKCIGCTLCAHVCPYGAARCWEKVKLRPRPLDLENINKLLKMDGVFVVNNVQSIINIIRDIILNGYSKNNP